MNEPTTFYRINLSPVEKWLQGAVMRQLQQRIDEGLLVPVEPDYEAMLDELEQRRADGTTTVREQFNADDLRAVLSAGIGGDK